MCQTSRRRWGLIPFHVNMKVTVSTAARAITTNLSTETIACKTPSISWFVGVQPVFSSVLWVISACQCWILACDLLVTSSCRSHCLFMSVTACVSDAWKGFTESDVPRGSSVTNSRCVHGCCRCTSHMHSYCLHEFRWSTSHVPDLAFTYKRMRGRPSI